MRAAVAAAVTLSIAVGPAYAEQATQPVGVTAIPLDGLVELAWKPVAGATYTVYRGPSGGALTAITSVGGVTATTLTDAAVVNGTTYDYAVRSVTGGVESTNSSTVRVTPRQPSCSTGNAVVRENCFPGTLTWKVMPSSMHPGIEGFGTANSINRGGSVDLKVNGTPGTTFDIEIYRTGYYGGTGARHYSTIRSVPAVAQPTCPPDGVTGLIDCSAWSVSATLTTTASWPSGLYLLRLVDNATGKANHVILAIRDDASTSDLFYGLAVTDYQAYNGYGGKSLYDFNSTGAITVSGTQRAVKVSFDRPYNQAWNGELNWYTKIDHTLVYWLEREGYDVAYQANTDMERNGAEVRDHKAYVMPAHDEYYSAAMRAALKDARDAGKHLFVSGSNNVYWKIRFENSPVSGEPDRVQVTYKSTASGVADPSGIPTGTWRDPAGANLPENELLGVMYVGDNSSATFPLAIDDVEGRDRIYRHSGLDTQAAGTETTISDLLGWEWDAYVTNGFEPVGVTKLASSTANGKLVQQNGASYTTGETTSHVAKYTAASGALVFATGTNYWSRGLVKNPTDIGVGNPSILVQQATVNALSDMGVLPQTPSADVTLDAPGPQNEALPTVTHDGSPASGDVVSAGTGSWKSALPVTYAYQWQRCSSDYQATVLADSPSGYWRMGEAIGSTTAQDASGNGKNGTYSEGVTLAATGAISGNSDTAATFGGVDGAVDVPGIAAASFASAFTIEAWLRVNVTAHKDKVIAGKWTFADGGILLWLDGESGNYALVATSDSTKYLVTGVKPNVGRWEHVVGTWDGSRLRLYRNGILMGSKAFAGITPGSPQANFKIGSYGMGGGYLNGTLDEVAFYGQALSARDVESHYAGCRNISAAANATYTLSADDVGATIRVVVTASNSAGASSAASAQTPVVSNPPPANTATPSVSGTAQVGGALTTTNGTWSGSPTSYAYQWQRSADGAIGWNDIAGATTSGYVVVAADQGQYLRVRVTATNDYGSTSAASNAVGPVAPSVISVSPPDGQIGVAATTVVTATFSNGMNPATISGSSFTLRNSAGSPIAATVTYDAATRTATLDPDKKLSLVTTFTARLDTTVTASDGTPLASVYSWRFQTAAP